MKKLLPLFALFFVACSSSPEEKLIADYEQNLNGTHVDLSLDIQSIEQVESITAADSVAYYAEILNGQALSEDDLTKGKEFIHLYENEWAEGTKKSMRSRYEPIKAAVQASERQGAYAGNPDQVLANKYLVTYTIKNPILGNAEQTITKYYYINSEGTKILATE